MPRTFAPEAVSPESGLVRLREGNARFVAGEGIAFRRWYPGLEEGQSPFAVVLGCSDSRTPAEYVFDQGLGDLFVIRVAGNIVAPSLVGSVEFAASQFGTRLVVVMGHTQCGAVGATVHTIEHGGTPVSKNIMAIVERILPHVEHVSRGPGTHEEHLAAAVRANAIASARELQTASPILRELVQRGRVVITAAVLDLATGVVSFLDT